MPIVIKKRIDLSFLGTDYNDSYLVFSSISIREYEELLPQLESIANDNLKSLQYIKTVLNEHFLEGKFQGVDVKKEDLEEFDLETLMTCFQRFTGQADPKVVTP